VTTATVTKVAPRRGSVLLESIERLRLSRILWNCTKYKINKQRSLQSTRLFLASDKIMSFRMSDTSHLLEVQKYIDENDYSIERLTGEQSRDRTHRVTSSNIEGVTMP